VLIKRLVVDTRLENHITEEIRAWSAYALEQPNANYNDFPACPFAAKAWADNKVDIQFNYAEFSFWYPPEALSSILKDYDDNYELIILVNLANNLTKDAFHTQLEELNELIATDYFGDCDLYVMGFHPEDESNEIIDDGGFETYVEEVYSMVFVQRLSLLCEASEKLMRTGYYDRKAGDYEIQAIMEQRNELYRRLKI
jgi:hypothetical protein